MLKNKLFRRLALLVSLLVLLTSTVNTTFGYIVTKTDSLINTFVPFESIVSDFLIRKSVEHPFGEDYVIPKDIAFDFKVDFGSLYAKTTIKTTAGTIVADEKGSILVSVKPGQPFKVEGIDTGTKITVTEMQKENSGFAVKDGAAVMEGVVAEDGSLQFQYINQYTPAGVSPVNVTVKGTKILEGRDWQEGDCFSFQLEHKQADGTWSVLGTKSVTYQAQAADFNRFDCSDLVQSLRFDAIGVYAFRMTEIVGDLEQVDYDQSINTFAITVTDADMDGQLEISLVTAAQNAVASESNGQYCVEITFNNTFIPAIPDPEDITVAVAVEKTVQNTGVSSIGPAGFEFMLEDTASGKKQTLKSDENGQGVFTLPFTAADAGKAFTYTLSEINGGMAGVTYDTTVYHLSVAITLSEEHQLVAAVTLNGQQVDSAVAAFQNIYHTELPPPEERTVTITASKTVKNTGSAKLGPDGFEFVLKNTQTGEELIANSNQDGKAAFNLLVTPADIGKIYTYTLSESNMGEAGMTYDQTVYDIALAVTLGDDNTLITTVTMNGTDCEEAVAEFVNTYHADVPEGPQTGDNSKLLFWFVTMIASGIVFTVLILCDRRYANAKH